MKICWTKTFVAKTYIIININIKFYQSSDIKILDC